MKTWTQDNRYLKEQLQAATVWVNENTVARARQYREAAAVAKAKRLSIAHAARRMADDQITIETKRKQ